MFRAGTISDVVIKDLARHADPRGWLIEVFRKDETEERYLPVMGYVSMTNADLARGPHEHVSQSDYFAFLGPSTFKIYLWDNRKDSPTYMTKQVVTAGERAPKSIIIPPGVVHAYKNIGGRTGMVINCPNQLYAGPGKKEPVDEIRHETDPNTRFVLD